MKGLRSFLFLLLLINQLPVSAQWQWGRSGTYASSWDAGYNVAADQSGNCYVIGMFSSPSIDFGNFTLNNANPLTDDIFLVKYSASAGPLWAKRAGGTDYDYGMAVTTDVNDNVIITGHYYSQSIIFGNDTLQNTSGSTDIYTVKYSSSGTMLWSANCGGAVFDESTTICADAFGNIYVAGWFVSASMTFGTQIIINSDTTMNTQDLFIVKYDPSGNVVWARSAGGDNNDGISSITSDAFGNIIITGSSGSSICNFGNLSLTNSGVLGTANVFTVKYDTNGNAIWGRNGLGSGNGVATDALGNIYVTGSFSSAYTFFGSDTLFNAQPHGGPTDIFLVKYDSSGTELWANRIGSHFIDVGSDVVTTTNGNAIIAGYFSDTTFSFGNTDLPNYGGSDIFVAEYDPSGNALSAFGAGGTSSDKCYAICSDNAGSVFITGEFYSSTLSFGASVLTLSLGGYPDAYIARLSLTTGIDDLKNNSALDVFPNPSAGTFKLSTTGFLKTRIHLTVTNLVGAVIRKIDFDESYTLVLSDEADGFYFLSLEADGERYTRKILIQH